MRVGKRRERAGQDKPARSGRVCGDAEVFPHVFARSYAAPRREKRGDSRAGRNRGGRKRHRAFFRRGKIDACRRRKRRENLRLLRTFPDARNHERGRQASARRARNQAARCRYVRLVNRLGLLRRSAPLPPRPFAAQQTFEGGLSRPRAFRRLRKRNGVVGVRGLADAQRAARRARRNRLRKIPRHRGGNSRKRDAQFEAQLRRRFGRRLSRAFPRLPRSRLRAAFHPKGRPPRRLPHFHRR